ncbi:MAG: hypothetical protein ACR2F8_14240 [Caulobacteraceae bacterium]
MDRWITSAKLIVLAGFLVVSAGTAWYEWAYVWPVKRCDARGDWWDFRDRQCLTPLPIWRITGRGLVPAAGAPATVAQRVAPGVQSTSAAPLSLAKRAATNSRSETRLR